MDYEALMDGRQKHVHEHFSPNSKLNDPEFVKKLLDWITFWRRNPSRFVQRYFGITLYLYQHIILYLMDIFPSICIVAARSAAKSFIIAVYACKEAILRPGSLIVVASATKKQARLIVSEKIAKEILPRSPLLQQEIKTIKDNQNDIEVKFNNGSSKLEKHIQDDDERDASMHRQRILRFNIELMRGEDFTLECFNDMLLDIDEYERFCETHPGYKNNRAVMAIANIKRVYQDHEENGGFLV